MQATDLTGNADPTPARRDWTIDTSSSTDTTVPKVDSVLPKDDAKGVARTTNVTAFFSKEMMASSINAKTFKLFKKGTSTKIPAGVTYFPDDKATTDTVEARATLDPKDSLRSGVIYKAVVSTGTRDLAGNPLEQQKVWFFTVG